MPYDVTFDPSPELDLPVFAWEVEGWSDCTQECGGGRLDRAEVTIQIIPSLPYMMRITKINIRLFCFSGSWYSLQHNLYLAHFDLAGRRAKDFR